jgi:hypothetical protein
VLAALLRDIERIANRFLHVLWKGSHVRPGAPNPNYGLYSPQCAGLILCLNEHNGKIFTLSRARVLLLGGDDLGKIGDGGKFAEQVRE